MTETASPSSSTATCGPKARVGRTNDVEAHSCSALAFHDPSIHLLGHELPMSMNMVPDAGRAGHRTWLGGRATQRPSAAGEAPNTAGDWLLADVPGVLDAGIGQTEKDRATFLFARR
jgi:hypothetical protein